MTSLRFRICLLLGVSLACQACLSLSSPNSSNREVSPQKPAIPSQKPIVAKPLARLTQPNKVRFNPNVSPWINTEFLQSIKTSANPQSAQGLWVKSSTQAYGSHQAQIPLSAASVTKIATTLAAVYRLGPRFRFTTQVGYTGEINQGTIQGDLIISGGDDPFFVWEDTFSVATLLQSLGIQKVSGDLIILDPFVMNFETDPIVSGTLLQQGLNSDLWPSDAIAQFNTLPSTTPKPNVQVSGQVRIKETAPSNTQWILQHQSLPLVELLKRMNRFSNNPMADQIASHLGGGAAVTDVVRSLTGLSEQEVNFINGSGLGPENKITPQGATLMIQALSELMKSHSMTLGDVMTIVGQDEGILDPRPLPPGLVVKSGTLNQVSALAGVIPTQTEGLIWFSIFNTQGDVNRFRSNQEALLQKIVTAWGINSNETSLRPTLDPTQIQTLTQPL